MRYLLIDRFLELDRGKRARAVKCVTNGEEFVRELGGRYPPALVLEALLQTGGVLARFGEPDKRSVLGKVERAAFPSEAAAGDRIVLEVDVTLSRPEGTLCHGVARVDDRVVGEAEFLIVFLPPEIAPPVDPDYVEYRRIMRKALDIPEVQS